MFRRPLDGSMLTFRCSWPRSFAGSTLSSGSDIRGTRLCIIPKGWPRFFVHVFQRTRACSPSRCLRPRPPCDVRVHNRFGGPSVVRPALSHETSLGSLPSAFTTKSSLAERTFRCLPCSPLDDHGQHFIGSQSTGSRFRVTFRREPATILFLLKIALAPRTRPLRPPSPFDDGVCPAVGPASPRPPFGVRILAAAAR